jgi:hypothetical protein
MENRDPEEVDAFRFWIGDHTERQSSVWKIWERNSQIYASSNMTNGKCKLSIHGPHPSKSYSHPYFCQYGFEGELRHRHRLPQTLGGVPTFMKWKRHEASNKEAHILAHIQFSSEWLHLREPAPKLKTRKFGIPLPSPKPGKVAEILIVAAPRPSSLRNLNAKGPATHLAHMPLGESEVCLILGRNVSLPQEHISAEVHLRTPTAFLPPNLQQAELGEIIQRNSAVITSHPKDYEAIRIGEVSGVDITVNDRQEVRSS